MWWAVPLTSTDHDNSGDASLSSLSRLFIVFVLLFGVLAGSFLFCCFVSDMQGGWAKGWKFA